MPAASQAMPTIAQAASPAPERHTVKLAMASAKATTGHLRMIGIGARAPPASRISPTGRAIDRLRLRKAEPPDKAMKRRQLAGFAGRSHALALFAVTDSHALRRVRVVARAQSQSALLAREGRYPFGCFAIARAKAENISGIRNGGTEILRVVNLAKLPLVLQYWPKADPIFAFLPEPGSDRREPTFGAAHRQPFRRTWGRNLPSLSPTSCAISRFKS